MTSGKSALDQLKENTIIVADSGSFELIKQYKPADVTTNPSLLYFAAKSVEYGYLLDEAIDYAQKSAAGKSPEQQMEMAMDKLFVAAGRDILKMIPGRVSTELDPRMSFDVNAQVEKALQLIKMYAEEGVPKERILIKIAATWEGIKAAEILENQHGVHVNMTLVFGLTQAIACAEANAKLISPFVGRILDWYVRNTDQKSFGMLQDPGVQSVTAIYNYYKKYGYKTEVMGASFRNLDEIKGLNGCDLLTIGAKWIAQLAQDMRPLEVFLKWDQTKPAEPKPSQKMDEKTFRWLQNQDEMAACQLSDGIRGFDRDARRLENIIRERMGHPHPQK